VAMATFKIDGLFFAGGVAFGVFMFGESVSLFQGFHHSTYMGRFILPELFGTGTGIIVVLVVLMALTMFYWAEIAEKIFGQKMKWKEIRKKPDNKRKIFASAMLVFIALFAAFAGQPQPDEKWNWIKAQEMKKLENRDVFIHPGELLEVMNDPMLYTTLLDVRTETDYNLFHLENARQLTKEDIHNPKIIRKLTDAPANTVAVVMSNTETGAVEAYKLLRAQGVLNLYILSGGVNHWLKLFHLDKTIASPTDGTETGDRLHYRFSRAVGSTLKASNPGAEYLEKLKEHNITFKKKVKIQKKKVLSGGCG